MFDSVTETAEVSPDPMKRVRSEKQNDLHHTRFLKVFFLFPNKNTGNYCIQILVFILFIGLNVM